MKEKTKQIASCLNHEAKIYVLMQDGKLEIHSWTPTLWAFRHFNNHERKSSSKLSIPKRAKVAILANIIELKLQGFTKPFRELKQKTIHIPA